MARPDERAEAMKLRGIPNYRDLDLDGAAQAAAERMEARADEPASRAMFEALVLPLLTPTPGRVLEVGAGTGALARRIAEASPASRVHASDKSEGMLRAARELSAAGGAPLALARWDVLDESAFPFGEEPFDLLLSSVMIPYLDDAQSEDLVNRLARRLAPGGVLAFLEQDLQTDAVSGAPDRLRARVLAKDERALTRARGVGSSRDR